MKYEVAIDGVIQLETESGRAAIDAVWEAIVEMCESRGWQFDGGHSLLNAEGSPITAYGSEGTA